MIGQIYFVECAGRLKIGYSTNVARRMIALQNAAPKRLRLIGSITGDKDFERRIHRELRRHREHGEWFKNCADVRDFIGRLIKDGPAAVPVIPKQRKRRTPTPPPANEPPPWVTAIRGATALLDKYEIAILGAPKAQARAMFITFADAVNDLERIIEIDGSDAEAPAWLASFEQRLSQAQRSRGLCGND